MKLKTWPKQGEMIHRRAEVIFNRDDGEVFRGIVVRDDVDGPMRTIIRLDDGRVVLAVECQWRPADEDM